MPFSGSVLACVNANNSLNASVAWADQRFDFFVPIPIQLTSFVHNRLGNAGTYDLKVNTVVVATVTIGASTDNVVFTPAAPIALSPGVHVLSIDPSSHATRAIGFNNNQPPTLSGTGGQWVSHSYPVGGGGGAPCTINFQVEDSARLAYVNNFSAITGNTVDEYATITFAAETILTGVQIGASNSGLHTLSIDGVDVATYTRTGGQVHRIGLIPASPITLSAGAHVFRVRRATAGSWAYTAIGVPATVGGDGAALVTGWSVSTNLPTRSLVMWLGLEQPAAASGGAVVLEGGVAHEAEALGVMVGGVFHEAEILGAMESGTFHATEAPV